MRVLATLLFAMVFATCGETRHDQALKLGLLTYISEGSAQNAQDRQRAFHLAIAHLNQAGGVFGRTVEAVVADTAQNPDRAVSEARRLAEEEDVHAIVGPSTSVNAIAVAERVAGSAGIPFISPAAGTARLTDAADNDFFFRATLSHRAYGPALARLAGERGFDNVGVLYRNDLWGQGLARAFDQAWDGALRSVAVEIGQGTVVDALRESAAGGAQVLVALLYPAEAVIAAREALDLGLYDQFLWNGALRNLDLIEAIGADALADSYGVGASATGQPAPAWVESYVQTYGEPPVGSYAREVYDSTIALALAAQAGNSTDGTVIRDHLRAVVSGRGEPVTAGPDGVARALEVLADGGQIVYQGASGPLEWDANGDLRQGYVGVWRYTADGRIEHVRRILYES
ncbi:MAG: ABC transporter substrate-binding protein [Chloroflexi bacterium]|nr:ABC transporter substrate-binding protein [Chloroflexota bacterium]